MLKVSLQLSQLLLRQDDLSYAKYLPGGNIIASFVAFKCLFSVSGIGKIHPKREGKNAQTHRKKQMKEAYRLCNTEI